MSFRRFMHPDTNPDLACIQRRKKRRTPQRRFNWKNAIPALLGLR